MQKPLERHIRAIQEAFSVSVLFRKDLVHLSRDILGAGFHVGEYADFDGAVAEGDLDEVARLDGLAGLGDFAVDEDAASFATVRRLMSRETFRYLSNRMGNLHIKSRRAKRFRRQWVLSYRVSFRALPGLNTILREAAMVMGSRVRGLMP